MESEMKIGYQILVFLAISQVIAFMHFWSLKNNWKKMPLRQGVFHFLMAVIEWPVMAVDYFIFYLRDRNLQMILPFFVWFVVGHAYFQEHFLRFLMISAIWLGISFIIAICTPTNFNRHTLT